MRSANDPVPTPAVGLIDRYLAVIKLSLTRALFIERDTRVLFGRRHPLVGIMLAELDRHGVEVLARVDETSDEDPKDLAPTSWQRPIYRLLGRLLKQRGMRLARRSPESPPAVATVSPDVRGWRRRRLEWSSAIRTFGLDWPREAETMIGLRRLDNVDYCVRDVLRRGVPGDLIEAGVWRGGVTILMRAILAAYGDETRTVWVADSFRGLPKPDAGRYPADRGLNYARHRELAIDADSVRANFARYGLLDEHVRLLVGWFYDTLPNAPIESLAVIRLDGDLYESTMDTLRALYPKLSIGGYVIADDYGLLAPCRRAVDEYRAAEGITDPLKAVDWNAAYWQRTR